MKRQATKKTAVQMIPEYGQKKLINYADSFYDLAHMVEDYHRNEAQENSSTDRQLYIYKREQMRMRNMFLMQLKEMAETMRSVATETYLTMPFGDRRSRLIEKALKEVGIESKEFHRFENKEGYLGFMMVARCRAKECITVEDMAALLSVVLNIRLIVNNNSPVFVSREFQTYRFYEEPVFHAMEGIATAIKDKSNISGDNYRILENQEGHLVILLSDGSGSGQQAAEDSEQLLDIVEKLFAAGFSKEQVMGMINSSICIAGKDEALPTLDICDINLYSGEVEIMKAGASCTYRKRGHFTDRIFTGSLPLGAQLDAETDILKRELEHGDYIIMLSDGVVDAISTEYGEDLLSDFIGNMEGENPTELANRILKFCLAQCRGEIKDDMTILVIGVWKDEGEDAAKDKTIYRNLSFNRGF